MTELLYNDLKTSYNENTLCKMYLLYEQKGLDMYRKKYAFGSFAMAFLIELNA